MVEIKLSQAMTVEEARELCSCGHKRLVHGDRLGGLARGHGQCLFGHGCRCVQFTWVSEGGE